ncbi:hypothetical protein [Listeria fleischmannii]|nr:hypothetical protein [Listeria fleischmannii]
MKPLREGVESMEKSLFEYTDEEFTAHNMVHACAKFLDEAWGNHYVKYLDDQGLKNSAIDAVEDLEEMEEDGYYRLKQKLENGSVLQIEVWSNDDGTYQGWAKEMDSLR